MRKSIVLSIIFASVSAFAATKPSAEQTKQYNSFKQDYSKTLSITNDKATFLKEFNSLHKNLKDQYASFSKNEKTALTPEGNQMALDIEMLEPLEILASGKIDGDSCTDAQLINELNQESDVKTYAAIKSSLQTLCK